MSEAFPTPVTETPAAGIALAVEVDVVASVNFSLQQNAVPTLRGLTLRNEGQEAARNVVARISVDPAFADPLEIRVERIAAGESALITDRDLHLSPSFLDGVSERISGHLVAEVTADGVPAATIRQPIAILARNEWCGVTAIPEILAAFSLPNDPAVAIILRRASEIVGKKGGMLNGYQSGDREAAAAQIEAIYEAVAERRIRYVSIAASFEGTGQKIRTPTEILGHGLANCIDMTMLLSACAEQCDLRPLALLHEGHAYFGCWLDEKALRAATTDDRSAIKKREQLGELLVLEATCLTAAKPNPIDQAQAAGRAHLDSDKAFQYAVDICRARKASIRPIPNIGEPPSPPIVPQAAAGSGPGGEMEVRDPLEFVPNGETRTKNRLDLWKGKLLDLTLRNRLLNFRETGGAIQLLTHDIAELENALEDGKRLQVLSADRCISVEDPRGRKAAASKSAKDIPPSVLKDLFGDDVIASACETAEHAKRLTKLYRESRNALEENGSNSLFLALGMMKWQPAGAHGKDLRAPLLLVPVELKRKSVQEGYVLARYDEETLLNASLVELLRQHFGKEIPGVNPLPEDDSGVDVRRILDLVREAIKDMPGWEVDDTCWLGQFSFAKYLLWKDLADRSALLLRNRVVGHLVQRPGEPFATPEQVEEALDRRMDTNPVLTTRSCDSSQLAAVMATADGGDFVLEGPPGTGKSQTITNMIAQCLAKGQRVLFVAEKRAALEVVHRRLVEDGMGAFCLELHSNKAGKLEVLKQLEATMKLGRGTAPATLEQLRTELADARDRLNTYAGGLHERLPCGLSAFDCLDLLAHERDRPTLPVGDSQQVLALSETVLAKQRLLLDRLGERLGPVMPADAHPLRGLGLTEWSPDAEKAAAERLDALAAASKASQAAIGEWSSLLPVPARLRADEGLAALIRLAATLATLPAAAGTGLLTTTGKDRTPHIEQWTGWVAARDKARAALAEFDEAVLAGIDAPALAATWTESEGGLAPIRWWRRFRIRSALGSAHRGRVRPDSEAAAGLVQSAAELSQAKNGLLATGEAGSRLLGVSWKAGEIEAQTLAALAAWAKEVDAALADIARLDPGYADEARGAIANLVPMGTEAFGPTSRLGEAGAKLAAGAGALMRELEAAEGSLRIDRAALGRAPDLAAAVAEMTTRMRPALGGLRNWAWWQRARQEAVQAGMAPFITALEGLQKLPEEGVGALHERSLRRALLDASMGRHRALGSFDGREHRSAIATFRRLDDEVQRLSQLALSAALADDVRKAIADRALSAEQAVVNHELGKKRRHIPIRKLLASAPRFIARLKPAMLMSPLSVAQFLDAASPPFDVVIFDEASQIPVWDAVGAIARGTQLIVVGDPKQLPPTSFFASSGEEDEGDDDSPLLADLESILDELLRCKLPHRRLQWHYRSRHEGLITFSNRLYYESDLMTFPSNQCLGGGVTMHRPPGAVYDKGGTRTNLGEAQALVDFLVSHLKSTEKPERSYGVVTFSQAQQELVENLLEKARMANPEIERHFGDTCPVRGEPVFVKNLENVQGDERDVILFSICYGPDKDGKVSMNFGPLNQAGGERRLNVAVTRAKEAIHVFTCLRPDQIDTKRTSAKGVADLRSFLDYAERGATALPSPSEGRRVPAPAGFVQMIEGRLRAMGYETRAQVGTSSYRIDIGVVNPKDPVKFLLGVECDGGSYAGARNARDRDKLREAVLGGLGWKLHRVWSMDWWFNPTGEMQRLEEAVKSAIP